MSLLKPKFKTEKTHCRIQVSDHILDEIKRYCEYADFKKIDEFLEETASYILMKDKAFNAWKEMKINQTTAA
jgi:hypothetical protein